MNIETTDVERWVEDRARIIASDLPDDCDDLWECVITDCDEFVRSSLTYALTIIAWSGMVWDCLDGLVDERVETPLSVFANKVYSRVEEILEEQED